MGNKPRRQMDGKKLQLRRFKCTVCEAIQTAPKTGRHGFTKEGHTKHFYCFVCKEITEQKQLDRWS